MDFTRQDKTSLYVCEPLYHFILNLKFLFQKFAAAQCGVIKMAMTQKLIKFNRECSYLQIFYACKNIFVRFLNHFYLTIV